MPETSKTPRELDSLLGRGNKDTELRLEDETVAWIKAVTGAAVSNLPSQGGADRAAAEADRAGGLIADRRQLDAERKEFERQREELERRRNEFDRQSNELDRQRREFDRKSEELKTQSEAIRRLTEPKDDAAHDEFVKNMRNISNNLKSLPNANNLSDVALHDQVTEFESSIKVLESMTPGHEGYRSAWDRVFQNCHRLQSMLLAHLALISAQAELAGSNRQALAAEDQARASNRQARAAEEQLQETRKFNDRATLLAQIGAVLTLIYMIFTAVNYGTGTAVNLKTLKQG